MASDMVERVAEAIKEERIKWGWTTGVRKSGAMGIDLIFARAAIEAMREPTEAMVRATVIQTDHSAEHLDFGASVVEGMPPLAPRRQHDGIVAAADVYRDWQAMIDAALQETSHVG